MTPQVEAEAREAKEEPMKQRTIYNNPTGRAYCCHPACDADAEFLIEPVQGNYEDATHACRAHLGDLATASPTGNWNVRLLGPEDHGPANN